MQNSHKHSLQERESELAQIRARFQKGRNKEEATAAEVKVSQRHRLTRLTSVAQSSAGDVVPLSCVNLQEPLGQPAETNVAPPSEPREEVSSEATPPSRSSDTPMKRFTPGTYWVDTHSRVCRTWTIER